MRLAGWIDASSSPCLPGAPLAPLQPLSRWSGLAKASRVTATAGTPGYPGSVCDGASTHPAADAALHAGGDGSLCDELWQRHVDMALATTTETDCDGSIPAEDDAAWADVAVPENYSSSRELSRYWGPVWYRRKLHVPPECSGRGRFELRFDAVDYLADVFVGGAHLGRHEGYFAPFAVDATDALRTAAQRGDTQCWLHVRVQDPLETAPPRSVLPLLRKRWIKGTMNHHDSRLGGLPGSHTAGWSWEMGQSRPTGGITGPVRLVRWESVRVDWAWVTATGVRVHRDGASGTGSATLRLAVLLTSDVTAASECAVTINVRGPGLPCKGDTQHVRAVLPPGPSRLDLSVAVDGASLWWEAALAELGPPALYKLSVEASAVRNRGSDAPHPHTSVFSTEFGIRSAEVEVSQRASETGDSGVRLSYRANGRKVFLRSVNYIPVQHWATVGRDFYDRDMALVKRANLHAVGMHAHVQSPLCYDATDAAGVAVHQDFPLQWAYASGSDECPEFLPTALGMASEMCLLLWNRPSVVFYCAHNEPLWIFLSNARRQPLEGGGLVLDTESASVPDALLGPSMDIDNRHLDDQLVGAIGAVDPLRFCNVGSGASDGIDVHEYHGTIGGGCVYDVGETRAPFVSEYGSSCIKASCAAEKGATSGWARQWPPTLTGVREICQQGVFGNELVQMVGSLRRYRSLAAFARATGLKSAFVAKYQTEFFRIHRDAPYSGYRWHFFVDHSFRLGLGLLDIDRKPAPAYHALQLASRPRMVTTTMPTTVLPSGTATLPLFAINDAVFRWRGKARWRVEAVASAEVCTAEPFKSSDFVDDFDDVMRREWRKWQKSSFGGDVRGSYVVSVGPALHGVASGEVVVDVGSNETVRAGTAVAELMNGCAYRLVTEWEGERNTFGFVACDDAADRLVPGTVTMRSADHSEAACVTHGRAKL